MEKTSTNQQSAPDPSSRLGKRYTATEKQEILDTAQLKGVKAASNQYKVSTVTIYHWRKLYKEQGATGLEDGRSHNPGAKPIADWKRSKVLAVKESEPGFGPSQIRNQLRSDKSIPFSTNLDNPRSTSGSQPWKRSAGTHNPSNP